MEQLRDCRDYHRWFSFDESSLWPPSYPKTACLVAAAVHSNIEKLRVLLDSPDWYEVCDRSGRSLLHIAVDMKSVEVFNYLLSLEVYPLDAVDDNEETALITSLKYHHRKPEYFPKSLIRRGADLNLRRHNGETALHICCRRERELDEIIAMLLYYGADPTIPDSYGYNAFESYVSHTDCVWNDEICSMAEHLFYLTFDELGYYKIDFEVLLLLADKNCRLFRKVYDCVKDVHFTDDSETAEALGRAILEMNLENLSLLKKKFEDAIRKVLSSCHSFTELDFELIKLENVQFLLETNLKSPMIEIINNKQVGSLMRDLVTTGDENMSNEKICFMLSYGMTIFTSDLDILHAHFGNCELFRILLYMDLEESGHACKFTRLYYDVRTDIENICLPFELTSYQTDLLLGLCAHQKMKDHCSRYGGKDVARKVENLPQMPSLVELARNVFRKYFIRKMKIASARQFYTMLKLLPISTVYKDIITYQRKIY